MSEPTISVVVPLDNAQTIIHTFMAESRSLLEVKPLPEDEWRITVKVEHAARLNDLAVQSDPIGWVWGGLQNT